MSRELNAKIAKETIDIVNKGYYKNLKNEIINIKDKVNHSIQNTYLYRHNDVFNLEKDNRNNTVIEITSESTLEAVNRLCNEGFENVVCLNFASAKNPGGGFLKGSSAQEESLARSSALYECIKDQKEMYDYNKYGNNGFYSDYMIFSDNVPVFRDDLGNLLEKPYFTSFITSPAVNAGVVRERVDKKEHFKIKKVMKERINKILRLGIMHNKDVIVLGAFGCGVFKNDPRDVAGYFKEVLLYDQELRGRYKKIVFAIYRDDRTLRTFKEYFKGL